MKFSYNWLQSYFQKKLPEPKKLANVLTLHFAEVESVEKSGRDFILNIDVRPNRAADCFSHNGIAREISAILGYKLKVENYKLREDKKLKISDFTKVEMQGRGPCARYTIRAVSGINTGDSPKWMQERLISCGLRPINNIVDIANYVMLETGQPLHAFDAEKIGGKKIIVRFASPAEKIVTLDGGEYKLDDDILVIADAKLPMAIAGIKGGKAPEIAKETKNIVIEAANFNSQVIRRASRKIGLRTDASIRFEHGIDPNLTEMAANRAAYLVQKISGGKIVKGSADIYPKKVLSKAIKLDLGYVEKLLGLTMSPKTIKNILESLGFKVSQPAGGLKAKSFLVNVPTERSDVSIQEDLIEEIGRIYGYERIPATLPKTFLLVPKIDSNLLWENLARNALKEADFTESCNYSFISAHDVKIFGFGKNDLIEVENPLSSDFQYLRPHLLPNLLKNFSKNENNFQNIKIFELGKIFKPLGGESRLLTALFSGDKFYEAKGVVDLLLNELGISDIWYDEYRTPGQETEISWWHQKVCAEIKIGQERIGFLGEVSKKVLDDFKIGSKIVYFDILFDKLAKDASEEQEYRPISKYPAAVRDIAVLVPKRVKVEEVFDKIRKSGGTLVRDIDLFDIYDGSEIFGQKKNLAFHIIYQSEEKTLSSSEIDGLQNKIIKSLEDMPEWQVRK